MFHRILVATDFSDCAREAWEVAKRLSAADAGELVACYVVPADLHDSFADGQALNVRVWAQAALEDLVREAHAKGLDARAAVRTGVAHEEIIALALDERADLIVIGACGRGSLKRMLLGGVTDRVTRLAPCAVLTVRAPAKVAAA